MSKQDANLTGGFNVEKALLDNLPDEMKAADREVSHLERKLDAARERRYRLRNIANAVGLNDTPEPPAPESTA